MKTCKTCKQEFPEEMFYAAGKYKHSNCKKCHNLRSISWAKSNPDKVSAHRRKKKLKDKYGVSREKYNEMLEAQGGNCAICGGQSKRGRPLDVDHCHETGRIRGLLCDMCNKALGMFYDSPSLLNKAAEYLGRGK